MTDQAKVNHATIQRLELSWRKSLNELNCHLHPLDTISSSIRSTLKECEPSPVPKKLFGSENIAHQLILAINKFRFKDGKGDPKGFVSALQSAGLPKGLLPRYRGNCLHIMFNLAGKFHAHRDFFLQLFSEGTITCGGLQSAILHDFQSSIAQTEFHILSLIGKLLSGTWMLKFYTAGSSQEVSHLDGISIVKNLIPVLKHYSDNPQHTITSKKDFFGDNLSTTDSVLSALQQTVVADHHLFDKMMKSALLSVITVLERQYSRYFEIDLSDVLRKETESARCHNIDAEAVMGMFSAALNRAPNATLSFLSARIRAQKNKVVDFIDFLPSDRKESLIQLATSLGRKQCLKKRKRTAEIRKEIAKRLADRVQKKRTVERGKIERKLKLFAISDIGAEFDLDEHTVEVVSDILSGKVVGHKFCHIWYDSDSQDKTLYLGKFEKLLKKGGGTYRVGYWSEGEEYEDSAEDYDLSMYALAADAICGDLTLS